MNPLKFLLLAGLLVISVVIRADTIGTAFTYQGELVHLGQVADGTFDFQFDLYAVQQEGSALTSPIQLEDVTVSNGIFSVSLDFGLSPFTGQSLWLQIGVRPDTGDIDYTLLSPRQNLTATPYAVHASTVSEGSITAASIAEGTVGSTQIADFGITSIDIANSAITQAKLAENSVGSPEIIDGSIGLDDVNASQIQLRISGRCEEGYLLVGFNPDGTLICELANPTSFVSSAVLSGGSCPGVRAEEFFFGSDGFPLLMRACPGVLEFIKCNDVACAGNDVAYFSHAPSCSTEFRRFRLDPSGYPAVLHGDWGDGGYPDLCVTRCADENCEFASTGDEIWGKFENGGVYSPRNFGDFWVTPDNHPVIVFDELSEFRGWLFRCNDPLCDGTPGSGDEEEISVMDIDGPFDVKVLDFGNLNPVLLLDSADGIFIRYCTNPYCSEDTDPVNHNFFPFPTFQRFIVGPTGFPVFVYRQVDYVLIVQCNDPVCGGEDDVPQVLVGNAGGVPKVTFHSSGYPTVAFTKIISDAPNELWILHCNDEQCANLDEHQVRVSTERSYANYIRIGSDGKPIIVSGTTIIHCTTTSCP